ncbi:MAG: RNA polymerase subunit sigma [Lachnospiraceae bacterium]|nr:RNA polymerase subunit sigma [Lachnospiraceae bacterium]
MASTEVLGLSVPETINTQIMLAKRDRRELDRFIRTNKKFILTQAYKTCKRFISESDDEYSIALIAFSEAVESYDESKGSFNAFAALVIKRRLIDYIKSESRHRFETPVDTETLDGELGDDDDEVAPIALEVSQRLVERGEIGGRVTVQDEISALSEELAKFNFGFMDIAESTPKAAKTKESCRKVIRLICGSSEMVSDMKRTGMLPGKRIKEFIKLPPKVLERHRKYIISAVLIISGDYPKLAEYMSDITRND